MKILVDTREQKQLKFKHPYVNGILITKLEAGDYGCKFKDGHISPVFFERKSIGDLYGSLGKGHKRFTRELMLASEHCLKLVIIIEGTLSRVLNGYRHSTMKPGVIVKQLFTIQIKYDVPVVFCKDRVEMSKYILHAYCAEGRLSL